MAQYPNLNMFLTGSKNSNPELVLSNRVIPYLVEVWLNDYTRVNKEHDIIETSVNGFSYLFDILSGRLISAWGISKGRHAGARDHSRMAGHPLSDGPFYHRGHAIPHTLGGPTDINLVTQNGAVNIGPFRVLEKKAVATPGSLYFTYWYYSSKRGQRPSTVDQGLIIPGGLSEIRTHPN